MPSGSGFEFGPFQLDPRAKRLLRDGAPVALPARYFNILLLLVSRAGQVVPKEDLFKAGWQDDAVADNSIAQAVWTIRGIVDPKDSSPYIETVPRLGYRFAAPVARVDVRGTDEDLDALLSPYRALMDGRARLETLSEETFAPARAAFAELVARRSDFASFHVGLANACLLQYDATRTTLVPNLEALRTAERSAREACQLDRFYGEAFATLGFVLHRTGQRAEAHAALRRSTELEPDNWLHWIRRAEASSGQERLFAARRALVLLPGCPWAHWLIASVYVQRNVLVEAALEVDAGLAAIAQGLAGLERFPPLALDWLKGLLCLAQGQDADGMDALGREVAREGRGLLYAREIAANAYAAIGAHRLRSDPAAALAAFEQAIGRVPHHPMAHAGLAILDPSRRGALFAAAPAAVEMAVARAAVLVDDGDAAGAAGMVAVALAAAPPGNAGWLIPIEPLLGVSRARETWAPVLALLRTRGA